MIPNFETTDNALFFLGILLFGTGCSDHNRQSINKNLQIDTAKLFDPKPQKGKEIENEAILDNCVILDKDNISINIGGQKTELQNNKELQGFLQDDKVSIGKQKFYIIYSDSTSNKKIIDIIDIVKGVKIDNYKAISLQRLFKLNVPNQ